MGKRGFHLLPVVRRLLPQQLRHFVDASMLLQPLGGRRFHRASASPQQRRPSKELCPLRGLRFNRAPAAARRPLQHSSSCCAASPSTVLRPLCGLRFNRALAAWRPPLQQSPGRYTASASTELRPLQQPLLQQFSGRCTVFASSQLRPLRCLRFNRAPANSSPLLQRRFSHVAASSLQPCSDRFAASASTELSLLRCLHFNSAPTASTALQPRSAHFAASASTAKPASRHPLQQRSGSCVPYASTRSFGHCAAYASTALCFLNLSLDFSLSTYCAWHNDLGLLQPTIIRKSACQTVLKHSG